MTYQTLRQQCKELLAAKRYDELQALLSSEREKIAAELSQTFGYIPVWLPKFLRDCYAQLLPAVWLFVPNRPSVLREEARLATQNRRLATILEMEQKLLEALSQEAQTLTEEARTLSKELAGERLGE